MGLSLPLRCRHVLRHVTLGHRRLTLRRGRRAMTLPLCRSIHFHPYHGCLTSARLPQTVAAKYPRPSVGRLRPTKILMDGLGSTYLGKRSSFIGTSFK